RFVWQQQAILYQAAPVQAKRIRYSIINQEDKLAAICHSFPGHRPFVLRSPAYLPTVYAPGAARRGTRRILRYSPHLVVPPGRTEPSGSRSSPAGTGAYDRALPVILLSFCDNVSSPLSRSIPFEFYMYHNARNLSGHTCWGKQP